MLMPKEMENVYLFFTWIISGEDNAFSGETALEHNPPHFHARHSGREGVFAISPLAYLHGDLTPKAIALVVEWASQHGTELESCWKLARDMQPIPKIAPLE